MNLKALRQRAADLKSEIARVSKERAAIGNAAVAEKRVLSDEERSKFTTLGTQLDGLQVQLDENAELLAAAEAANEAERNYVGETRDADAEVAARARRVLVHDRAEDDPMAGFADAADFGRAVRAACMPAGYVDRRLSVMSTRRQGMLAAAPSNPHLEGGGSGGEGYEVPAQLSQRLFELVFEQDDLLSAMNPEPTDSNAVDIEADETTPWGAAGVQAFWRGENTAMTGTKLALKYRTVRLHELFAFVSASDELLEDAPRLNNRLTVKSADAIRWKASEAIAFGTGSGQPLGFLDPSAGALVTQTKEVAQVAATIVTANVLKAYSRLIADGGSPFWFANRDTIPQIAVLTIGTQPIYTAPNAGIKDAPGGMLLGLPIRYSEHAQTVGTKGDLVAVNPAGYYATIKRGGVKFASSIHLYFDYNATAFRWTFRLGGQPYLSAPVAAAKGSNSKSHFVCLETRA